MKNANIMYPTIECIPKFYVYLLHQAYSYVSRSADRIYLLLNSDGLYISLMSLAMFSLRSRKGYAIDLQIKKLSNHVLALNF